MDVKVPQVAAARVNVGQLTVGQVSLGDLTVGQLTVNDARIGIRSGQALLEDVHVTMRLEFTIEWRVSVDLGIAEFSDSGTDSLGSITIPFDLDDWEIPGLRDIVVDVPVLTGTNVRTSAEPIANLQLRRLVAERAQISDVAAPSAGFSLDGLALTSLAVEDVTVPAVSAGAVGLESLTADPLTLPRLRLRGLTLPSASVDDISSGAVNVPLQRRERMQVGRLNLGFLQITLFVRPSAATRIARMRLTNVRSSLSAGAIDFANVTVPLAVHNITMADLGISAIDVPSISLT